MDHAVTLTTLVDRGFEDTNVANSKGYHWQPYLDVTSARSNISVVQPHSVGTSLRRKATPSYLFMFPEGAVSEIVCTTDRSRRDRINNAQNSSHSASKEQATRRSRAAILKVTVGFMITCRSMHGTIHRRTLACGE